MGLAALDHQTPQRQTFLKSPMPGAGIGHTSVYQNLEALQSAGVIERLTVPVVAFTATAVIPTAI